MPDISSPNADVDIMIITLLTVLIIAAIYLIRFVLERYRGIIDSLKKERNKYFIFYS